MVSKTGTLIDASRRGSFMSECWTMLRGHGTSTNGCIDLESARSDFILTNSWD